MNALKSVAIVLIVAGVLGLVYGSFSYTRETHEVKLGPVGVVSKGKADGCYTDMGRGRDNSDWQLTPSFWSQKKLILAGHFSLIRRKLFIDGELMRG